MNSAARKGWMVAASIGAVEALKDQLGFCRWNYALRSLQQHAIAIANAKTNLIVSYHNSSLFNSKSSSNYNSNDNTMISSSSSSSRKERVKKTEESHNKVMHLSCWGPNSVRF